MKLITTLKRTGLGVSLFVLVFSSLSSSVFALNPADFPGQNINLYRRGVCVETASTGDLSGSGRQEQAWNFFTSKGLSKKQTAGIIGNFEVESGVNPKQKQIGGGPGRGIAQWSVGDRWAALIKWAGNKNIYDLSVQLDYVWEEFTNVPGEKNILPILKKTTTIRAATDVVMRRYERPNLASANFNGRVSLANEAYGKFKDNPVSKASSDATAASADTSDDDDFCSGSSGKKDIVSIAQKEFKKGVLEQPIGCDSGNRSVKGDCGPDVNKYTDNHLEYWCADFVSWVYKQAGTPFTGGASGGWRIPGVPGLRAWFQKNGTYTPNSGSVKPKPGDVYIYRGDQHTGIVTEVNKDSFVGISGNTSTDNYQNGVGVGKATIPFGSSKVDGFGSLDKGSDI